MFVEYNFEWKGRNLHKPLVYPINNDSKHRYIHNVLVNALQSFQTSIAKNEDYKKLSLNARKKYFWGYIKNRELLVLKNNTLMYMNVDKFDKNGKIYNKDFKNYSNLLEIDALN
jgi:hypothetical protein